MAYKAKAYTLREESTESGTRYFISFKDGQGEHHELEVSENLFFEFRQMERKNRNLQQWNQRHREFNEVWDETLYRRALRVPKSLDECMIEVKQWGAAKKMPGKSECNDDSQLSHGGFRSHFTGAIDLKNSLSRRNHNGYGTARTC